MDVQLTPGCVVEPADIPRSHMVQTSSGVIHRNLRLSQLNVVPNTNTQKDSLDLENGRCGMNTK